MMEMDESEQRDPMLGAVLLGHSKQTSCVNACGVWRVERPA
jgi:hypothetical protein